MKSPLSKWVRAAARAASRLAGSAVAWVTMQLAEGPGHECHTSVPVQLRAACIGCSAVCPNHNADQPCRRGGRPCLHHVLKIDSAHSRRIGIGLVVMATL